MLPALTEDDRTRAQLWLAAAKPPMYTVAIAPVVVGAALAKASLGYFPWSTVWDLTWPSVLVILWLNLSNDAYDAETDVDRGKAESVVNLTGGKRGAVLAASLAVLLVGGGALVRTVLSTGGELPLAMLAIAIVCGYVYQGPPFRWSYKGLGEPLCFVAFGPLATVAFHLCANAGSPLPLSAAASVLPSLPAAVWGCASLVGLTTTAVLFCSHFHQVDGDRAAGKRSPVARMGTAAAATTLAAAVAAFYAALAALAATGCLPVAAAAWGSLSAPLALVMARHVWQHHDTPRLVRTSKFLALRWHVAFFVLLSAALAA